MELLAEAGYEGLTIERVAARAGVGKPTIYRRWSSKAALVVDTIRDHAEHEVAPDTGTTRGDLMAIVATAIEVFSSDIGGVLVGLVAAMHRNAELADAFHASLLDERKVVLQEVLRQGVERGDLRPDLDPSLVVALLIGPVFHRLLVSREPLTAILAEQIVDAVLTGIKTRADPGPA
jgi:AcrR family transcriptional regulator